MANIKYVGEAAITELIAKFKNELGKQIIVLEENGSTTAGTWLAKTDRISSLAEGQLFLYKVAVAGASTTTLNITGSAGTALGAKNVYRYGTTKLGTQYAVGSYILLYYNGSTFTVVNDYDANSYAYVRQYQAGPAGAGTGTKYPILTRYNLTDKASSYDTAYSRFHTDVTIDTSDGTLDAPSLSENGTPLTGKYYLASNPSNFTSNVGTITGIKMNGASKGTSGVVDLGTVITDVSNKADLVDGKVPSSQLPSYVDDVLEYSAKSSFPATGESGKIYVDTATNLTYRWGGSAYVEISPSLAIGTTSTTAAAGDHTHANMAVTNANNNFSSDQTFKNITLYSASGDSPRLTFQRGTLTDGYNDWSLYDSSGYLYIQQRGQSSSAWETRAVFDQSSANFQGTLKQGGKAVATQEWVEGKGYTTVTESTVSGWGFTKNEGTVTGSSLTSGYFVVGNGSSAVEISSMQPSTSSTTWSASSDVYVPTMKAISNYVTGLGYTSNAGTVTSVRVQAGTGLSSSTSTAQSSSLNTTISIASGYKLPTTTEASNWNNKMNGFSKRLSFGSTSDVVVKFAEITLSSEANFTTDMMFLIKGQIVGRMELSVSKPSGESYPTVNIKKFFNAASGTFIYTSGKFGDIIPAKEGTKNFFGTLTVDRIGLYVCFKGGSSTSGDNVVAYTPFEFYSGESAVTQLTGTTTAYTSAPNTWQSSSWASGQQFALTSQIPSYSTTSSVTSGSSSLVTSGGVYTALENRIPSTTDSIVQWTGRIDNLRTDSINPKPGFLGTVLYDKYAKKVRISGGFWASTAGDTSYSKWPIDKILAQVGLTSSNIRTPLDVDVGSAWIIAAGYDRLISTWMTVGATMRYDVTSASGTGAAGLWFGRYWNFGSDASWGAFDVKQFASDGLSCQFTAELEVY